MEATHPDGAALGDQLPLVRGDAVGADALTLLEPFAQLDVVEALLRGGRQVQAHHRVRLLGQRGGLWGAEAGVQRRTQLTAACRIVLADPPRPVRRDVQQQVGAQTDRAVMDSQQVSEVLGRLSLLPEPAAAQGDVALRGQVACLAQVHHVGVVLVEIRGAGDVLDRVGGQAVLVAHPADGRRPHVEDHRLGLQLGDERTDAVPGVLPARGARPVEPQLVQLAVVRAQLPQLGEVELVVDLRVLVLRGVAVPGREVQAELHAVLPAGGGELRHHVAGAVAPRGGGDGVVGRRGGPQAEAVVMLRGEDHVDGAEVAGGAHPLVGVEVAGREEVGGHGAVAPLLAREGVDPEVEEDAEAILLPLQLFRGGTEDIGVGGGAVRGCVHAPIRSDIGPLRQVDIGCLRGRRPGNRPRTR